MANPDYLVELEKESKRRQAEFINHIAKRLGRDQTTKPPEHPFRGAPEFWKEYNLSLEEKVQLFMENWEKVGGEVTRVSTMEEAGSYIHHVIRTMEAKYLLCFDQEELKDLSLESARSNVEVTFWNPDQEDLLNKAAGADIGIGVVDFAIAHTGTVLAMSSPFKGRAISLLPTAFMAIIKADRLRTRLGEVLKEVSYRNDDGAMPAGVHFVTGPSRSADIENDLTIGVHGPGVMYAVIVG
ncbi:LUD domain-containing protein [Ammoniphilus sp. CFH 90114]|uniref:LutC/YkgG family protein n=1 Tax=Ammoniphilus sp. CFH 90114 TaxID=2493665 RepID=UPI00100E865A|nr:LUD domain-containing protein [Ammoniphilus sp. CFH 90114]RXT13534.1 lactate utilization protein C [Ammoniphilus sp. CFH 90114]